MRKLADLRAGCISAEQVQIDAAAARSCMTLAELSYFPLTSRSLIGWIVLLDEQAQIRAYAQFDGF